MAERIGPLGIIERLVKEGTSATEGLRQYRAAGGKIRDSRWYGAFGELQAELSRKDMVRAAPTNRLPTGEEISQITAKRHGAYIYRGAVMVVERDTDQIVSLPASIRSNKLVTYRTAISMMQTQITDTGSPPGMTVIGAYVSGVRELIPETDESDE